MSAPSGSDVYLIFHDHEQRAAIADMLSAAGSRVKLFSSAQDFLALADAVRPGSLIVQLDLPDMGAIEVLERLHALQLNFPAILISAGAGARTVVKALKAGAVDFLEQPVIPGELLCAIKACEKRLIEEREKEFARTATSRVATLTEREREILERLVSGMPNKAIARELEISPRTVEFHRARVMAKMQAATLSELVLLGAAAGIGMEKSGRRQGPYTESATG